MNNELWGAKGMTPVDRLITFMISDLLSSGSGQRSYTRGSAQMKMQGKEKEYSIE